MVKTFNKKSWLISALRRASIKYPPAFEAKNRTKEVYYITSKKGKQLRRVKFTCEMCGKKNMKASQMNLDHISPLVGPEGFIDWNTYINNYLIDSSGFQYICEEPCHSDKTFKETGVRKKKRQKKKKVKKKS